MNAYILVLIAGLGAGAWPLVMQRSGLSGPMVAVVYSLCSLAAALVLLLLSSAGKVASASQSPSWLPAIIAGLLAAMALLLLSTVVAKVTADKLSLLYIVMLLVQISVPILISIVVNRGVSLKQGFGLAAALLAALLLK